MLNEKTETTPDTVLEEMKRITDPKNVGQAVAEIKAHIDASEARIRAELPIVIRAELAQFFKPFVDIIKYAGSLFLKKGGE
jgi:hypothetical protein